MLWKPFLEAMPQLLSFYLLFGFHVSDTALPGAVALTLLGENLFLLFSMSSPDLWLLLCLSLTFGPGGRPLPWLLSMVLAVCSRLVPCQPPMCVLFLLSLLSSHALSVRPEYSTCPQHTSDSASATDRQLLCWPTGVIPTTLQPSRKSQQKPHSIEADYPCLSVR